MPNLLSWQVAGWELDTLYAVEISNVTLQSGATRRYASPVFIDRANIESEAPQKRGGAVGVLALEGRRPLYWLSATKEKARSYARAG